MLLDDESNGCEPASPLPVSDATSPSQRPRRNAHQKAIDYTGTNCGLLWREEKELKKALYASLNETAKKPRSSEMGGPPVDGAKNAKNKSKNNNGNAEPNQKKAKVHAQRKFAQGSTPNSPIPTPLKMCSTSNIAAVDVFPCRRPKTEDFLTFLCLRGTPILPPSLDFFNNWSREDSCSEKSYYSEPDNFQDDTNLKDNETPMKDGGDNNGKFNFKSSTDMSTFHRQASAKLSAVKQKLNLRHSDFQDAEPTKSNTITSQSNDNGKKRKTSVEESSNCFKKLAVASNANNSLTSALTKADTKPEDKIEIKTSSGVSSMNALKEKYKKQLLEKKANPTKNTNLKGRPQSNSPLSTKKIECEKENDKDAKLKGTNRSSVAKLNAKREEIKKSLEKRKTLRSARKINEMTSTYLEVSSKNQSSTRARRAKLVPPIVEVDSDDSDFEDKPLIASKLKPTKPIEPIKSVKKLEILGPVSGCKVIHNIKHQMVLNQKPVVKLANIALQQNSRLLCVDHSYGKAPLSPPPIVIPKPKIITKPIVSNNKPDRIPGPKSKSLHHTEYKPTCNIVVEESKRCTRSQKQRDDKEEVKMPKGDKTVVKNDTVKSDDVDMSKKMLPDDKNANSAIKKTKLQSNTPKPSSTEKTTIPENTKSDKLLPKDKPKPTSIKVTKENVTPKPKIISIDSSTEDEDSEEDACSSDDSFLLSSFVKSTISKVPPSSNKEEEDKKMEKPMKNKPESKKIKVKKSEKKNSGKTIDSKKKSLTEEGTPKKTKKSNDSLVSKSGKKKLSKKKKLKKNSKDEKSKTDGGDEKQSTPLNAYLERRMKFLSDSSSEEELLSSDSSISVILPRPPMIPVAAPVPTQKESSASNANVNTSTEETEQNSSTSYIIENMTQGTGGFENISNEMATATLPGELMFGSAEEIQGLMTSEFSGVFDENFPAGAILLTTRDTLTQAPLHFIQDITPTKTVADASTNTCEDDIILCSSDGSYTREQAAEEPCENSGSSVQIISSSSTSLMSSPEIVISSSTNTNATPAKISTTSTHASSSTTKAKIPTEKSLVTKSTTAKIKNIAKNGEDFPGPDDMAKLVEAPVYAPTIQEFQDPLEFIEKITPEAEKYGICRIIPPSSFKPECKVNDDMRFTAHNQYVHKMLYRWGPNRKHVAAIRKHLASQGIKMEHSPLIGGIEMDLSRLYHTVESFGGLKQVMEKKKWQKIADTLHIPKAAQDRVNKLYDAYCKYLVSYATLPKEEKDKLDKDVAAQRELWIQKKASKVKKSPETGNTDLEDEEEDEEDEDEEGNDCVTKGRSMSLSAFYRVARNTMSMWYRNEPITEEVEKDYWKLVSQGTNHVVVHAGNIDSSVYGTGFPTNRNSPVSKHPWNLKVLTNNPGSILRSMGPVSGVTIPTLHVGMLFTSGCYFRDPHRLPWIEYLHTGADKIWYSVPNSASDRFRKATKAIMPDVCTNNPIWLPSDTAMIPPSLLIEHGSPLCRTVQESGQFVVIFPSAFTSTICTGYAVSESVYFAPPYWLEMAQNSFQDIQNSSEPPVFSLERLLFAIANDNRTQTETLVKLLPLLKHIRDRELCSRKQLFDIGLKVSERLVINETAKGKKRNKGVEDESERECEICRTHCYISLVVNTQDETVYCLEHGYQNIQRKEGKTHKLLYTYDQSELNDLVRKVSELIRNTSDKGGSGKKKARRKLPMTP